MRRALVVASLVLLAVVVGLVLLARSPWIQSRLRAAVLDAVSERLDADVQLDGIRIRLFPPSLELTGLAATSRARPDLPPVVQAARVRLSVDPVLLLSGRLDIDRVVVTDPRVHLVFEGKEVANLPTGTARDGGRGGGVAVVVRTVTVEGGRVRLDFPQEGPLGIEVAIDRLTLRPDLAAGAADFEAAIGESLITRRRFRQPVSELTAEGRISAEGLAIRRFQGRVGRLVAAGRGRIGPFPDPRLELTGTVRGPLASVARIYIDPYTPSPEPFELAGEVRAAFTSSGPAEEAAFEVSLTATDVRVASVGADRVALEVSVTYDRTTVRSGTIEVDGGVAAVTGSIDYDDPIPFDARLSTSGIRAGALAAAIGAALPPAPLDAATISGQVRIAGRAAEARVGSPGDEAWRVGGDVALRIAPPPGTAAGGGVGQPPGRPWAAARALLPATIAGRFDVDEQAVRLQRVSAVADPSAAAAPVELSLAGQVGLDAPYVLALDGGFRAGRLAALDPLLGLAARGWPLEGAARAEGVVAGPAAAPTFVGRIEASGLAAGRYRIDEVTGPITASRRRIRSTGLVARHGGTRVVVEGGVDLPEEGAGPPALALEVRAEPLAIEDLLAASGVDVPVSGRGRLGATLSGPVSALAGKATLSLAQGRAYGQPVDRLDATVAFDSRGAVRLTRLDAAVGRGRLTGRAARGSDGALSGTFSLERLPAGAIQAIAERELPVSGTISAEAVLAGTWTAPRIDGRIRLADVAYGRTPLGDSGLAVQLAWPDVAIRGTVVQREVEVVANARLTGERPFVVALDFNNPNLAPYLAGVAEGLAVRASMRGYLRAAGSLDDLERARAELRLAALRLDIGDFYLQNVGEVALRYEGRLLSIVSATLQGPTSRAVLGGHVDLGARTLDLRVNGGLDLSLARLFTDRIAGSRGSARIVAQAIGPFAAPRLFGAAEVEGGTLTLRGVEPALTVEELSGSVVFDATRVVVDNVTMRIGGGQARLAGAIELTAFRPSLYNLSVTFDDVRLAVPSWLPSTSRGELRLSGAPDDLLLWGQVQVLRATYNRRIDVNLEALYRAIRAALRPRRETTPQEAATGPRVDIRVTADGDVRVETGLFDAELQANLHVVGRLPEPNLLGSAEVVSGTITFRDTQFTVTRGRVDFIDPFRINPSFDLSAEATIREYQIVLELSGTVDKYRLDFSSPSHPSLTELDILSLLTVGVTTAEARGADGTGVAGAQTSTAEVLAILSGTGLRRLEREVEKFVGVDTFQIDPAVSRTTGAAEPRLTVGKRINPDVTVTYSTGIGSGGDQAVQIEYRLSGNLALVAQWDETASFGGGVKFRFEFR